MSPKLMLAAGLSLISVSVIGAEVSARPIVRDHSPAPIVRDHRPQPVVRDHRTVQCLGNMC